MKLLATVTLRSNQFRAHFLPIVSLPEVEELVLVADKPPPPDVPKIRAVVPSNAEKRLLGRAGSKLVRCALIAAQMHPDWVLSYNIMPHGVNAHLAGRLAGARTMFHLIGGPNEWRGGGWRSGNAVLGRLPRPVQPLERALLSVLRGTTVVCTMGTSARADLIKAGIDPDRIVVVPPSVDVERFAPPPPGAPRTYDLLSVGDLIERKRPWDFVAMVAQLRHSRPNVRAAVVGDGPLRNEVEALAAKLGVGEAVDFLGARGDVATIYKRARVFSLCSRHEGLSVAMIEAMASGLPCVMTDVGDLSDLLQEGRNGHLLPVGDISGLAARVEELLADENRYGKASAAAREDAASYASTARVSELYRQLFRASLVDDKAGAP